MSRDAAVEFCNMPNQPVHCVFAVVAGVTVERVEYREQVVVDVVV